MSVARVAVEGLPFFAGGVFDYALPDNMASRALPGARITIPFGSTERSGFILSVSDSTDFKGKLRPVSEVCEDGWLVPEEMIALALWMSEQYITPVYDCLRAMLPGGLELKTEKLYLPDGTGDADGLAGEILGALRANDGLTARRLSSLFGEGAAAALKTLISKGLVRVAHLSRRAVGDNTVPTVNIACTEERAEEYLSGGGQVLERHRPVVEYLLAEGVCDRADLCYMTGATQSILTTLKKHGIIGFGRREVRRAIPAGAVAPEAPWSLSPEQQNAADALSAKLGSFSANLLYGVTGSGKTHVFLELIDKVLKEDKGVIVMVPEIMLTVQMTARLRSRYGDTVAVMHSDLSAGQRLDEWKRIREGRAKIAVGTRTAVFAPFERLGLIIMDEEQEHTYKSELSPRFHARSVALQRGAHHKCPVLLASATPSLESRYLAEQGRYGFFELKGRFNGAGAPPTRVVDMRAELREGNTSVFSRELQQQLAINLNKGEQSILFINRRGFNTFVSCRDCGYALACPNCSIGMTYHIKNNRLMCHYCGHSEPVPQVCPECGGSHIRFFGTGTQKAELELQALFPQARVLRMDADTTAGRFKHEQLLTAFDRGDYDILLGTQMVTKGLDFPNVTLVGILAADASLYSDDYRAGERTFSLITQVIGRAGRAAKPGRALIQTYSPEHEILSLGVAQDYDGFFRRETAMRKLLLYPPFSDICQLVFSHEEQTAAQTTAEAFKAALIEKMTEAKKPMAGLGPAPCKMAKIGGQWRFRLLIKCRAGKEFRSVLRSVLEEFYKDKKYAGVRIDADVNPYNIQ